MKIAYGTILLVTDGSRMLVLRNEGDALNPELSVVAHRQIDNPPNREQLTDAPGVSFSSMGGTRSSYRQADIHQLREDRLAIEAAQVLAETVAGHEADIIVVAPPATLHILRDHYTPAIRKRLIAEVDKDLVKHPATDIVQILTKWPRRF
ncbi:host attachment family protein [Sphingobium sp. JS3065]|uniref:host attachment family protein n=1 Tax=Sphingobium sp. JS3065 TaxID=2970925 RepID=UPI002264D3FA|nr:host attachment family protein [Sphingobium sp. JS3065]UZW57120.1 host attachment family protein [Sphingobium sp. JS3065]